MEKLITLLAFLMGLPALSATTPSPLPTSIQCSSWSYLPAQCGMGIAVKVQTDQSGGLCGKAGNYYVDSDASGYLTLHAINGCRSLFSIVAGVAPSPLPSPSPSASPSARPSATPSPTPSPKPSATPAPSASPSASPTPHATWSYWLPRDANGYSILPTNGKAYYVDSRAGSDKNSGLTATAPLQSLSAVSNLVNKSAGPTHVYLARGSTWQGFTSWTWGYPLTIDGESYGKPTDPRPLVSSYQPSPTPSSTPSQVVGQWDVWNGNNVVIAGVQFSGIGIGDAINLHNAATNILLEDIVVDGYWQNIIGGPITNFIIRRSQSINAWDASFPVQDESKPQGLYLAGVNGGLIEDNLFDHNAWHLPNFGDGTEFGHDIYISNYSAGLSFNLDFRNNVISNGLQSVKGPATGNFTGNLFYLDGTPGYIGAQGGTFTGNLEYGNNQTKTVWTYHLSNPSNKSIEGGGFGISGNESAGKGNNNLVTMSGNIILNTTGGAIGPGDPDSYFLVTGNTIYNTDAFTGFFYTPYKGTFSNNIFQGSKACTYIANSNFALNPSIVWTGNTYSCPPGITSSSLFKLQYSNENWAQYLTLPGVNPSTEKFGTVTFANPSWTLDWPALFTGLKSQSKQTYNPAFQASVPIAAAKVAFTVVK